MEKDTTQQFGRGERCSNAFSSWSRSEVHKGNSPAPRENRRPVNTPPRFSASSSIIAPSQIGAYASAPLPKAKSSSSSRFSLRNRCLGGINLRRPPVWDVKHVPVVSKIAAHRISPAPSLKTRFSATSAMSTSISSLKEFARSIFEEAWHLTDVAGDLLFSPRGVWSQENGRFTVREGQMKGAEDEDDEGILEDEMSKIDNLPWEVSSAV